MVLQYIITIVLLLFIITFWDDVSQPLKKFFKIPGVKIFLPLFVASWFAAELKGIIVYPLIYFNWLWQYCVIYISSIINLKITYMLIFFLLAMLPPFIGTISIKRPPIENKMKILYYIGFSMWFIAIIVFLLTLN